MFLSRDKLENFENIGFAVEALKSRDLSENEKDIIISFMKEANSVKWGEKCALRMHGKSLLPFGIKKIFRVDSMQKAINISLDEENSAKDNEIYESLLALPLAQRYYKIADDILTPFGNKDYHHEFWLWASRDMRGVLVERLIDIKGVYSMRWEIYRRGHYPVGHKKGKHVLIF